MLNKILTFSLLSLLALPSLVWASSLTQPHSELYTYQNTIELQEEFISGTLVNGTMGANGWGVAGGTTSQVAGEANHYGILRLDTSAVINTLSGVKLDAQVNTVFNPTLSTILLFVARLNTNDANTQIRIGAMNSSGVDPPAEGIYLEKLVGDANWFCVTRAGGVQTRTNSTIAVNTNFTTFQFTRNSSGVQFTLSGVNVCSLITTNIPTVFIDPAVQILNTAAASKTVDLDYFEMRLYGFSR